MTRRTLSLRLRVVLITAVTVTVMVAVTGAAVILTVSEGFVRAADWVAMERAEEVAELAESDRLPAQLPSALDGETTIQVVRDGEVVSSTTDVLGVPVLPVPLDRTHGSDVHTVDSLPSLGTGAYSVAVVPVRTPQGPATVITAVSTEDVSDVADAALGIGALALLALLFPLSVVLWVAVGRTLAPVEAIRERAATITGERLSERVPEPDRLDEIGRLSRTINAMLGRLDESADQQRRFLADAAHELRSPVASLRTQLETAGRTGDRGGRPAAWELADLMADTLRMQALVDQLLVLARGDSGATAAPPQPVDLDDTVGDVLAGYRTGNGGPVVEAAGVAAVQVEGDPGLLEQVVRNLLDNAVRHAQHRVQVSLREEGGTAVLLVDDDGPGVPEEARQRIFDRFTRLDGARQRDDGGVGLGLAIVADIVRDHGGRVTVEDSPTGGARFKVVLPTSGQRAAVAATARTA